MATHGTRLSSRLPDASVHERTPGRDHERDEIRQRRLPRECLIPPTGQQRITLVDGEQHGSHDHGDHDRTAEERRIAHGADETPDARPFGTLQSEPAALARDMIVMTGSSITTKFPAPGDRVRFAVEGMGEVALDVANDGGAQDSAPRRQDT